ncbi:MAG: methyltransferase domain-containing protein [Acidobacteria bacterium]|nr:methyltransferase domain-containing protein [Acidobacteriota bacterium]
MTASYHDVHLTDDPNRPVVWRVLNDYLARWIPSNASVLEIGAGYCHWINGVRAATRIAVDVWPELPRFAAPGVDARVLDASTELRSLGAGRFGAVLASNLLEHFEPAAASRVVADVAAVLAPGGRFVIIQPNFRYAYRRYFDDYTHRSIFTDVSLPALLRSQGFAIDACEPRFLPYSMQGARTPIRPWLVRAYLRSPFKPWAGQMLVVGRKD